MSFRGLLGFAVLSFAMAVATARPGAQAPAAQPQPAPAQARPASAASSATVLQQYCATCHNERLKSGGFVIDPAAVTNVSAGADQWEKVVRKLRTQSMPPPGVPRPDAASYDRVAMFLETELDRAEAARPHLGKLPLTHRLSRTEYQNAIRDLLALESLPREVSIDYLLPPDNISSGFDNIADLLFISPSNMERYLDAARKISRLAIGDPAMPVMVNIHRLDPEHPQDERVDELPFGTRGGIAVRSDFPVDGTYIVRVDVGAGQGHDLEILVDGERVALRSLGSGGRGTPAVDAPPGQPDPADPDPTPPSVDQPAVQGRGAGPVDAAASVGSAGAVGSTGAVGSAGAGGGRAGGRGRGAAAEPLEFTLSLKAGPKLIGVAFVQRTDARDEATLRPRMRSRGTQPAINSVTISGPYKATGGGDSPSRRRIFVCRPASAKGSGAAGAATAEETACARRILSMLARRAYRRPSNETDVRDLLPFYEQGRKAGSFDLGIQKALERLLVSSQFLFRIEREPSSVTAGAAYRISDIELASRLSFFIWSSIPDDELLDVAAAGRLKDSKVLEQQVRRMLADPRSESLVTNFAAQWLYLRDIAAKQPDEILFADFDETLRTAMQRETELFIGSVFRPSTCAQGAPSCVEGRENRSVLDLLKANYTFLNERLARHYGVPNIKGSYFRRVTFPDGSVRGGLLGQGSVLTITSYSTRTSPVLRGKWVLENLLSAAPPPPPADVPSLKTETAPGKPLTLREAMVQHRAAPACAGCHARMDPIGFAMENFDAVGRWRERDGQQPIDATGVFPEGTKFEGIPGLKNELLRQPEQFVGTVAERLLMYAIGRNLQYYDAPTVRAVMRDAEPANHTLASLVLGIVKSRPFQMRESGGE
jgi:mono/diheme cytochrome c family protein